MHNPDMDAAAAPQRHPWRLAGLVAGGTVLVLVVAALVVYVWLRGYTPLSAFGSGSFAPGPGLGADVEPVTGSGGKTVFLPVYRRHEPFDAAFTLHNTGRFAVTVTALDSSSEQPELRPVRLFGSDSATASADPARLRAFRRLRLEPGDTATVVVRWAMNCAGSRNGQVYSDSVALRYRYLSVFTRTERVALPFAVTLRCAMAPPAEP
jgi:hypothetical protein